MEKTERSSADRKQTNEYTPDPHPDLYNVLIAHVKLKKKKALSKIRYRDFSCAVGWRDDYAHIHRVSCVICTH